MNILKPVGKALSAINPLNIGDALMQAVIKKLLISATKGILATFVAALLAFEHVAPAATDPGTVAVWGFIVTGVHMLGTFVQHLIDAQNQKA